MALVLKRIFHGYSYVINDLADPRAENLFLMSSPLPTIGILVVWYWFISKWGPEYMRNRKPLSLKHVMIVYNIAQVVMNCCLLYHIFLARHVVSWRCTEVDYSRSYWGKRFLNYCHMYFLLKILDLLDTVFFVLRKKSDHLSFLHIYHHLGMCAMSWIGTKFVGGGHAYFLGLANCTVHTIMYGYYLLTAYDSKYSKLLWLKKSITQLQLVQFVFILFMFAQLLFRSDCNYPKIVPIVFVPQNFFIIVLFSDFYIRTYYLKPTKKKEDLEEKMRIEELQKTKDGH